MIETLRELRYYSFCPLLLLQSIRHTNKCTQHSTIHITTRHRDWILLYQTGWTHVSVCMHCTLCRRTLDPGLEIVRITVNAMSTTLQFYSSRLIYFAILILLNILILGIVLPRLRYWCWHCSVFETPWRWRFGADTGSSFYVQFVILLCAFVGESDFGKYKLNVMFITLVAWWNVLNKFWRFADRVSQYIYLSI